VFAAAKSTLCAVAALAVAAQPAGNGPVRRVSPHWAGYVATGGSFSAVQATWVEPRIRCDRASSSAAFWIGLGGATAGATGLEQIGTVAECSASFLPSYSAWYELIPAPAAPVELPVAIAPGDVLTARVSVEETTVTLAMRNLTTGEAFSTAVTAPALDLSSAEWIAEAPSSCLLRCVTLPLPDFGHVGFRRATASTDVHTGPIDDAAWTHQSIRLSTARGLPSALPSALSADGRSFTVRWRERSRRA
jgi:hypothetical protein